MRFLIFLAATLIVACDSSDGPSSPPCAMPIDGFCVCGADAPPVGVVRECSAATMGGEVVCCQGKSDCICGRFDCSKPSSDSCSCTSIGVGDDVKTCSGTICCASTGGTCRCGTSACRDGDKQVSSCTAESALCSDGTTRVVKCGS
jgi:hypothetical protein